MLYAALVSIDVTGYEDLTQTRKQWSENARCAKPEVYKIFDQHQGRPQKRAPWWDYCNRCVVKLNCLAFAIVHNEEGIWGGTTESQRKRLSPLVKSQMLAQAQAAGWFEPAAYSLDLVLSESSQQPPDDYEFDYPEDLDALFA